MQWWRCGDNKKKTNKRKKGLINPSHPLLFSATFLVISNLEFSTRAVVYLKFIKLTYYSYKLLTQNLVIFFILWREVVWCSENSVVNKKQAPCFFNLFACSIEIQIGVWVPLVEMPPAKPPPLQFYNHQAYLKRYNSVKSYAEFASLQREVSQIINNNNKIKFIFDGNKGTRGRK